MIKRFIRFIKRLFRKKEQVNRDIQTLKILRLMVEQTQTMFNLGEITLEQLQHELLTVNNKLSKLEREYAL